MRRLLRYLLIPLSLAIFSLAQADDQLVCSDTTLTNYLIALIDALYDNGLTTFEQLLATLSQTDSGYDLLESIYTSSSLTLLAPTDSAFQSANIHPPFSSLNKEEMTNLVAVHILQGDWTYSKLPQSPQHAIASTELKMIAEMNSTVNSTANQAMILQQGDNGAVSVRMAVGNATTWTGPVDLGGTVLSNLVILPVDTVSFLVVW